eukprot:m.813698 g.813698  ORF g.813698 m.813698 type:complete len:265 (-) comp23390_c0_seq146:2170-2964(-)
MGFFKRNRSGNQIVVACMTSNVLLVLWFTLQLLSHLKIAVRRRVEWQRIPAHKISPSERSSAPLGDEETPRVAILFSGGIDSMMIAAVAHLVLPIDVGIDLVNVAFENPRMSKAGTPAYNVPDRLTGVDGLEELKQLPDGHARAWKFIAVDVPLSELQHHRAHIRDLVFPLTSVMDDSIGCALWFAARALARLQQETGVQCQSAPQVVLVGMGADEQFAGYGRHRTRFQKQGWQGLVDEVRLQTLVYPRFFTCGAMLFCCTRIF